MDTEFADRQQAIGFGWRVTRSRTSVSSQPR